MNNRCKNMFKAFQHIDTDGSGTLSESELRTALSNWNIPVGPETWAEIIAACDGDNSGGIDYKEFVDALARDTVALSAMGKRDMQSKEAMGVGMFDEIGVKYGTVKPHTKMANEMMEQNNMNMLYRRKGDE